MSAGTRAGTGAALQSLGQGLMQYTQYNIEEMRQKNLEAIRQQERGEDRALRAKERGEDMGARAKERAEDRAARDKEIAVARADRAAERADAKRQAELERFDKKKADELSPYTDQALEIKRRIKLIEDEALKSGMEPDTTKIQGMKAEYAQVLSMRADAEAEFYRKNPKYAQMDGWSDDADGPATPAPGGSAAAPAASKPTGRSPTATDVAALKADLTKNGNTQAQIDQQMQLVFGADWKKLDVPAADAKVLTGPFGPKGGAADSFADSLATGLTDPATASRPTMLEQVAPPQAKPAPKPTAPANIERVFVDAPAAPAAKPAAVEPGKPSAEQALATAGITKVKTLPEEAAAGVKSVAKSAADTYVSADRAVTKGLMQAKGAAVDDAAALGRSVSGAATGAKAAAGEFADTMQSNKVAYYTRKLIAELSAGKVGPDADRQIEMLAESGVTAGEIRTIAKSGGMSPEAAEKLITAINILR